MPFPAHAEHELLVREVEQARSDPAGDWGPTDVDSVVQLVPTDPVLLHGQVLGGLSPTDKPRAGKKPADYR